MTHMLLTGIQKEHENEWLSVMHNVVHSAKDKIKRTVALSAVLQEKKKKRFTIVTISHVAHACMFSHLMHIHVFTRGHFTFLCICIFYVLCAFNFVRKILRFNMCCIHSSDRKDPQLNHRSWI